MIDISQTTVALLGTIFTFIAVAVGSFISYKKAQTDDTAQFRADLLKLNEALKHEMQALRVRLTALEKEVHSKSRAILKLETRIEIINRVVFKEFGAEIDELLAKHGVAENVSKDERQRA